jgi:HlyD family secretion protein
MMRRRSVIFAILFLLAGGAAAGLWVLYRPAAPIAWQGYAEGDFVKIGPTQQGLLTQVLVARGQEVKAGALLFTQDEVPDRAARDQAAKQLAQAKDQLANLLAGGKETEIEQAQGNLADAQATLVRSELDFHRGETLLKTGFATPQNVDQLRAAFLSAKARVDVNEAALAQLHAPLGRIGEIEAQRSTVQAAQAALDQAQWRLSQRRVEAPTTGRIADVIAFAGETLAAGAPVISLLPPENIFVRFFVPETGLGAIHLGEHVHFSCDGCRKDLTGTVSFISPTAEYTPPLIYSDSTNAKLVFMIEARPPRDQAPLLNPGQPIEVRPIEAAQSR